MNFLVRSLYLKLPTWAALLLIALLLTGCKLDDNSINGKISGSAGNTSPLVSFGSISPSSLVGNQDTVFTIPLTYKNFTEVLLDGSLVNLVPSGTVSCPTPLISTVSDGERILALQTCSGDGTLTISIAEGSAVDSLKNKSPEAISQTLTIDNTPPSVSISTPSPLSGVGSTTYNFPISISGGSSFNLQTSDISVGGTNPNCDPPTVLNGSTATPSVSVTNCTGNGLMDITIGPAFSIDLAGNQNTGTVTSQQVEIAGAPGDIDQSFGFRGDYSFWDDIGGANGNARMLAVQSDGKIVIASSCQGDLAVLRTEPDGKSLDSSFIGGGASCIVVDGGSTVFDRGYAVALTATEDIILAGSNYGAANKSFLVKLKPDGTLDTTFDGDGIVQFGASNNSQTYDVLLRPDGKIVSVGKSHNGSNYDFMIAQHNPDGSLDTCFNDVGCTTGGIVTVDFGDGNDNANSVNLLGDGSLIVTGQAYSLADGTTRLAAVKLLSDGSRDPAFAGGGAQSYNLFSGPDAGGFSDIQSDGKIVLTGTNGTDGGATFIVMRLNSNGTLDTSFDADGIMKLAGGWSESRAIHIQGDGKILLAGFTAPNWRVIRLLSDGSFDNTFGSSGNVYGPTYGLYHISTEPGTGKILISGRDTNDNPSILRLWP